MKMRAITALLFACCLSLVASAQEMREPQNVITVTGNAQVFAAPDEASVRLGVVAQGKTAQEAQSRASEITEKFLAAIRNLNIPKEDIQTSRITLYPQYDNPKPGEAPRVSGYQASNVLTIRLKDFSKIGPVIDAGVGAGVNTVESIDFGLRNSRGPRTSALKEAVADARAKADAVADALGVKITGIYDVVIGSMGEVPMMRGFAGAKMDSMARTPVEPGQLELGVTVTVRYRLAGS